MALAYPSTTSPSLPALSGTMIEVMAAPRLDSCFLTLRGFTPKFFSDIHFLVVNCKFKLEARFRVRMGLRRAFTLPDVRVDDGEKDVGVLYLRVHVSNIKEIHLRHCHLVDGSASNDKALVLAGSLRFTVCLFKGIHACHLRDRVPAKVQNNVLTPGKRTADREVRAAAHDHGVSASGILEVLEVFRDMPGKLVLYADAIVVRYGYNKTFFHIRQLRVL